jgi:glyoxylase I family protein
MVDPIFPGAPTAVDTAPKRGTLNHLRLTVSDIPRAEAFYAPILDHMGFTLAERSDTRIAWGMLTAAGDLQWTVVGLAQDRDGRPPHDRYAPGFHHVAWNAQSRQDVDDMHALLVDRGAEVLDPPAAYDYWCTGYYAVFFADPDGLKLEYVHIPTAGSAYFWQAFQDRGINPFDYNDAVVVED